MNLQDNQQNYSNGKQHNQLNSRTEEAKSSLPAGNPSSQMSEGLAVTHEQIRDTYMAGTSDGIYQRRADEEENLSEEQ